MSNAIKPASAVSLALPGCQFSKTALEIQPGLPFDQWDAIGARLLQIHKGVEWWIADFLAYGEREYGKDYKTASLLTGYKVTTLRNLVCIAAKFEPSRRHDVIPFSYYLDVAGLEPEKQDELLSAAARGELKRKELRAEARRLRSPQIEREPQAVVSDDEFSGIAERLKDFAERKPFLKVMIADFIEDVQEWLQIAQGSPLEFIPELLTQTGGSRTEELVTMTGYARESLLNVLDQLQQQRKIRRVEQGGKTDSARGASAVLWQRA